MVVATRASKLAPPISVPQQEFLVSDQKSIVNTGPATNTDFLQQYTTGFAYKVDFYLAIVNAQSDLRLFDPNQSELYQQYKKVSGYTIKMASELTSANDPATGTLSITGEGFVYGGIVPNFGDVFIGDVGDGRNGLFCITEVPERATYSEQSVYGISFRMVSYIDKLSQLYVKLESRVVSLYHQVSGGDGAVRSILSDATVATLGKLKVYRKTLAKYYGELFIDSTTRLLVNPVIKGHYDGFLMRFIDAVLTTDDDNAYGYMVRFTVPNDKGFLTSNFYDRLCNVSSQVGMTSHQLVRMGMMSTGALATNRTIPTISMSKIKSLAYPLDMPLALKNSKIARLATPITYDVGYLALTNDVVVGGELIVRSACNTNYYVLGEPFYSNLAGKSLLEAVFANYMSTKTIDNKNLLRICDTVDQWNSAELFYCLPLVIAMCPRW